MSSKPRSAPALVSRDTQAKRLDQGSWELDIYELHSRIQPAHNADMVEFDDPLCLQAIHLSVQLADRALRYYWCNVRPLVPKGTIDKLSDEQFRKVRRGLGKLLGELKDVI